MKLAFFWIPAFDSSAAEDEPNRFLASHRVIQVEKQGMPVPIVAVTGAELQRRADALPGWPWPEAPGGATIFRV